MADWWQSDPVADPSFTGVIPGRPKPQEPEKPPSGYRWTNGPGSSLVAITGGPADKNADTVTDPKLKESENQAAFLTTNLVTNANLLANAIKADPDAAAPTVGQEVAGIFGQTARNFASSPQRQAAYAAQRLIVDSALTLGTGAAYTAEQIDAYTRGFFPQLGDSPEVIASKRKALQGALVAAKVKAGAAAPKIDEAIKLLGLDAAPLGDIPADNTARATGEALYEGKPEETPGLADMTDAQKASYEAFWKSNPNPTEAELQAWATANRIGKLSNAGEIIKAAKEGRGYSTAVDREEVVRAEIAGQNERGVGDSNAEVLLKQGATLGLNDEAAGVGRGLSYLIQGENPVEGYKLGRDAERLRVADARQQLGYAGTAIELAGGLASANPTSALAGLTGREVVRESARGGAAGGALAGFGSGEGLEDSIVSTGVGAAGGAAVGSALGAVSNRFASRGMDPALADVAAAENVRISQPMIEGNRRAINRAGVLESDPATAEVVQQGFANTANDIEAGLARLAPGGVATERGAAGESVQRAARRFITRSRNVANQLYDRARTLAGDATITPRESLTQLREEVRQLSETPNVNQGELAFINEIGEDLTRGPLSVDAVRGLRSSIRGRISEQGLTATQAEARAMRIIDSLGRDAQASLPADAANAFRRADAFYRERMVHIDDVLDRWIGGRNGVARLSGEQAFDKIKTMANSDGRRLAAIMRSLDPQERLDVAATLAQSLGRRGPEEPFSPDRFISQALKLSPSARRTVFGPAGAQSIDNLLTLSRRLQDARAQVNSSRTGRPVSTTIRNSARTLVVGLMGGSMGAGSTAGMAAAATAGAAMLGRAGLRALSARSLMSPRVSRWLAETADVNTPAQAQTAYRRLGTIIAREPALASELQPLHRWLIEAVNPTPALAEEGEGGDDAR